MLDQSIDTIMEKKEENVQEIEDNRSVKSEVSATREPAPSVRKPERRSERQKAKRQIFANGQSEPKEDSLSMKRDGKRNSVSPRRIFTSDYSSEEGDRDDPPSRPGSAYEIYKRAGEWWNVFPKTDYTYSERSQYRYEIAPGVLAMPNMSRRSIHSDGNTTATSVPSTSQLNTSRLSQTSSGSGLGDMEDVTDSKEKRTAQNLMSAKDNSSFLSDWKSWGRESQPKSTMYIKTHVEQYTSHREVIYTEPGSSTEARQRHISRLETPLRSTESHKYRLFSPVDSDTELDDAVTISTTTSSQKWRVVQWFSSITMILHLWLNRILESLKLKNVGRREYRHTYEYRRYQGSRWSKLWEYVKLCFKYIYLFYAQIFFFDCWLLNRLSGVRKWFPDRTSKLICIILLPLLFLAGCSFLMHLPPTSISDEIQIEQPDRLFPLSAESIVADDKGLDKDKLTAIIEKLMRRIVKLESGSSEQTNMLMLLENRLNEDKSAGANSHDIDTLKLEIITLKELYSQLKFCCDGLANCMTNEYVDKRIEEIVSGYLGGAGSGFDITEDRIRKIVKEALKIYDADKTGRVDYALESAGGQIISTGCTQRYDIKTRAIKLFTFTLYHENNNPRTVIQGNPIQPGACWAFQGFPGHLLIKLRSCIYVTGFTLEHAAKSILPNGEMKSAPRKFNVWGYTTENDPQPVLFGDYEFRASDENLQYFPVQNTTITMPYQFVELRVHSNHGQLEYTCLYRFRVHGTLA